MTVIRVIETDAPFGALLFSTDSDLALEQFIDDIRRAYPGREVRDVSGESDA